MIRVGSATILTATGSGKVSAAEYRKIMKLVNYEMKRKGVHIPNNQLKGVRNFLSVSDNPKSVKTWRKRRRENEGMDDYHLRMLGNLNTVIKAGGLLIMSTRDLLKYRSLGLKI